MDFRLQNWISHPQCLRVAFSFRSTDAFSSLAEEVGRQLNYSDVYIFVGTRLEGY